MAIITQGVNILPSIYSPAKLRLARKIHLPTRLTEIAKWLLLGREACMGVVRLIEGLMFHKGGNERENSVPRNESA